MKRIYMLAMAGIIAFTISSCKKDSDNPDNSNNNGNNEVQIEVKKIQRSLFLDFTATWCPPCGKYGHPGFKGALSDKNNEDKLVGLAIHASNSELPAYFNKPNNDTLFFSPVLGELNTSATPVTGYPSLYVNGKKLALNNQVQQSAQNEINAVVNKEPVAGIGLKVTKKANGVDIKSKVKFFQETSGEFYLTILLSEDGITRRQMVGDVGASTNYYDNNTIHEKILRHVNINTKNTNSPATFGDNAIISGTVPLNKEINGDFTFEMPNFQGVPASINNWVWNPNNTNVVAILWKKNGSKYDFVNTVEVRIK